MNDFLGQLNLTVQERRIVMGIFAVVIFVLNYLFVWPHFGEWGSLNKQLNDMRNKMVDNNTTILQDTNPTNGWHVKVEKYARLEGSAGVTEHPVVQDPQIQLQNSIMQQARKTGVNVENYIPGSVKTNQFFEEHSTLINIESQEPPLISFLYNMGNDPAMIRVGKLHLKSADQNRYRLRGEITLTANYTKQAAATVTPSAPAKPGAPGPKPVVAGAKPSPLAKPSATGGKPPPGAKPPGARPPNAPLSPGGRKTPLNAAAGQGAGRMPKPMPGSGAIRRPVPNGPPAPSP